MIADESLDPADIAPLVAALRKSSGDGRATILEALVRLPLAPEEFGELGVEPPAQAQAPLRPPWAEAELPGFTTYSPSSRADLDARLAALEPPEAAFRAGSGAPPSPRLDEEIAPAAVTNWFARAVGEYPNIGLGNEIVAWVGAYDGIFRPDLEGLFVQYERAALAECAAWDDDRRPGTWFLRDPDVESWRGYRSLCWQIGWTVSRGGIRGVVPGLAPHLQAEDETARTIAALLIADAADYVSTVEPPIFGGGYGPPARPPAGAAHPSALPQLLVQAARAGIVPAPASAVAHATAPRTAVATPAPRQPAHPAPAEYLPLPTRALRPKPYRWLLGVALVGGAYAIGRWLLGWFVPSSEPDQPVPDDVQCTVFAPPAASPGSTILVQVFAHLPEDADDARTIATAVDVETDWRQFFSLDAPVPRGGRLDFALRMPGLEIDDPVATLTWRGRTNAVQFGVYVPPTASVGTVLGTVSVRRDGIPLGHVKFRLAIERAPVDGTTEPQGVDARKYSFAFVSYDSQDRDEVLRRVQMLRIYGLEYFQDVLDLEPGEIWSTELERAIRRSDLFLLFWSSRARESKWVRREVDFALDCKGGDDLSPPEIQPVPIEGPPPVPPWDDLAYLHFDDPVLYFMNRPR